MSAIQSLPRFAALAAFMLAGFARTAAADVTIEEKSTIEAAIFKAHGESTENYAGDKKRQDSVLHCEGFMKMLCGNKGSGEIVRLDKNVSYDLQPSKKRYREIPFPTEAERKEAARRMKETIEKMKQCAAQQPQQPAVDTSKCQMSPAKVEVKNLGADGQILGHDVHHTAITMTSSCTNKETQEVCDMQFGFDTWLTSDRIAGYDERDAFTKAYLQKMGLVGEGAAMGQQVQQMLAPYAEQMKELKAKSADLKGQSLRSAFHVAYGGAKCAAAKNAGAAGNPMSGPAGGGSASDVAKDAAAQGAADTAASKVANGSLGGTVASRVMQSSGGKFLTGLFSKKKKADSEETPAEQGADKPADKPAEEAAPGMVTMIKFGVETTAVTSGPVPADRFEVPADWKRIEPKESGKPEEFTCPKNDKE